MKQYRISASLSCCLAKPPMNVLLSCTLAIQLLRDCASETSGSCCQCCRSCRTSSLNGCCCAELACALLLLLARTDPRAD